MPPLTPGELPSGTRQDRLRSDGLWYDDSEPGEDKPLVQTFPDVNAHVPEARRAVEGHVPVRSAVVRMQFSRPIGPELELRGTVAAAVELHLMGQAE